MATWSGLTMNTTSKIFENQHNPRQPFSFDVTSQKNTSTLQTTNAHAKRDWPRNRL